MMATAEKSATKRASREYNRRVLVAMALVYPLLLFGLIAVLERYAGSAWRYAVAVVPSAPLFYVVWAMVRYLARTDELQRRIRLEGLAFGFGAGSVLTFTYGFLQLAGLPQLSWFFVWPVYAVLWIIGEALARRRYAGGEPA